MELLEVLGDAMIQVKTTEAEIVVVDEHPGDYAELIDQLHDTGFRFRLVATGREALRLLPRNSAALWLVNVQLPDMSGFELFQSLHNRSEKTTVFLIGDRYAIEDELRSRAAGAALYACKPPCAAWLGQWRRGLSGQARG